MGVASEIRRKLTDALSPVRLDVHDDSERHRGHAGHRERGESHFRVEVVADAFEGKSAVERQRMVYGILARELADGVHALSLRTQTPDEAGA